MSSKSSKTFRKQALSLIALFAAIAAVFALTRLRSDPAKKQAQFVVEQLLTCSNAVEQAVDVSAASGSEPGLVQVDDSGLIAFCQAQFGDSMTQECLEKTLTNRLPTRVSALADRSGDKLEATDLQLTQSRKDGQSVSYSFSADLQTAAEHAAVASASGTITMTQEDGVWKASDITLNLK